MYSILIFALCFLPHFSTAYNILAFLPIAYRSHSVMYNPIFHELARRGHNVTSYSVHLENTDLVNFRQVNLKPCLPRNPRYGTIQSMVMSSQFEVLDLIYQELPLYWNLLKCQPVLDLINGHEKFDLLITEPFNSDVFSALAEKLNIPSSIYIFSTTLFTWLLNRMGSPSNPSYIPERSFTYVRAMSFLERVDNFCRYIVSEIYFELFFVPESQKLCEQLFGIEKPSLLEIAKNTSLILVNTHFSLHPPMPLIPGIVEVAGVNLKNASALPEDIEKFINESTHGVVYFCMGSLLRGETFPEEKRNAFMYAFSKIPQRVLWKWEGDSLPGKSDNIMISKWMPQRDILAHPNVKLFISHGGLLGTSEAVYEGVPILGIPIFGDQKTNVKTIEANGAGEYLDYNEISKEVVLEKIQRLLTDPKYKENAKQLSERYRDRPMSPLDTAVYWTEYVIRHKGAPHLKSAAVELTWYQYLLLDVIAFLLFVVITALVIIYYTLKFIIKFIISLICGKSSSSKSTKKQKKN